MSETLIIEIIKHISLLIVSIGLCILCGYIVTKLLLQYQKERRERQLYIASLSKEDKAVIGLYIANTNE